MYILQQNFSNTIAYRSYRVFATSQRILNDAVQYAETQIIGYACLFSLILFQESQKKNFFLR